MPSLNDIAKRFREADRELNAAQQNLREAQKIHEAADRKRTAVWQELMAAVKGGPDAK